MINAAEHLRGIDDVPVHMGVGGFHLFRGSDETIAWTAAKLQAFGLTKLVGAHCTGAHATHQIGTLLGLPRRDISIGAVGTVIDSDFNIVRASIE